MKKLWKLRFELSCLLSFTFLFGICIYWVSNRPSAPFIRFLLSLALFAAAVLFVLSFRRLWKTKWKKALKTGIRKALVGVAKLFIHILEKWNEKQQGKHILGGKTTLSFDFSVLEKEEKQPRKPRKWKQLQTNKERLRFLYRRMINERIEKGVPIYSYETPCEIQQKTEYEAHEEKLFALYINLRYDERSEPSEEDLLKLKDEFHIK